MVVFPPLLQLLHQCRMQQSSPIVGSLLQHLPFEASSFQFLYQILVSLSLVLKFVRNILD